MKIKYNSYSEIPYNEKRPVLGCDIKLMIKQYNPELYLIKNNKCDHKVVYKELEDDKFYNLYEEIYIFTIPPSGIRYNKFFIFE